MDSVSNLSTEAVGRVADALMESTGNVEKFIVDGTTYTKDGLVTALQNGQISAEQIMGMGNAAANALLQQTAAENETAITSTSQAIGVLMSAIGELISNFEANMTLSISKANLQLSPSWSNALDLGWKLIKGQSVNIGASGSIEFNLSGGVTGSSGEALSNALSAASNFFSSNGAGGLTDGVPSLGDYSTLTPT